MKRATDVNITTCLLEKRIINEEFSKAILEKRSKLIEMRENKMHFTDVGKNGGLI